jgi:hypothetical protein
MGLNFNKGTFVRVDVGCWIQVGPDECPSRISRSDNKCCYGCDGVSAFKRISNGESSFFLWHGHEIFIPDSFNLCFHPLVCFVAAPDADL